MSLFVLGLVASAGLPDAALHRIRRDRTLAPTHPNIVIIVTDDQRWDTLWAMPVVQAELVAKGVYFENAFVSNPECCPSRAAILTGQYSHGTGVYTNQSSHYGGFRAFDDSSTLATWLTPTYRTALVGKYLNDYFSETEGLYVPPGWDRWSVPSGNVRYYNYRLSINGLIEYRGDRPRDYSTNVLRRLAIEFIESSAPEEPLFLYFAPVAPHGQRGLVVPAPRDFGVFEGIENHRPPSYAEHDVSDKPAYITALEWTRADRRHTDTFRQLQLESLLAVDRAVGAILRALKDTGRLANTLVIYVSDNGRFWGEHRLDMKLAPYEESIRVPLVVRFDALGISGVEQAMAVNVDIAPTVADAAGVEIPAAEGVSLLPLLRGVAAEWRTDFVLEHVRATEMADDPPTYCGLRTGDYLYAKYGTGEEELYDVRTDAYEETNVASANPDLVNLLRARTMELCSPAPPGYG